MESVSLSGEYMQNIVPVMIMIIIIGAIAFGLDIVFVNNHNKAQQRMRLLSSIIMCCEKERKGNKRKK